VDALAAGVGEGPHQLLEKERVAVCSSRQGACERFGQGSAPGQCFEQPGGSGTVEGFQVDVVNARGKVAPRPLSQNPGTVPRFRPGGEDEKHRCSFGARQQVVEEVERRRVGPVQVVDGDDNRTARTEPLDERANGVEGGRLQRGRHEGCRRGARVVFDPDAQHSGQQGVEPLHVVRHELEKPAAELNPCAQCRMVRRGAQPLPQQFPEGPVGQSRAVGDSPTFEPGTEPGTTAEPSS